MDFDRLAEGTIPCTKSRCQGWMLGSEVKKYPKSYGLKLTYIIQVLDLAATRFP